MNEKGKKMRQISSIEEFDKEKESGKLLFCNVWAEWCEPCKVMNPIFEKLSQQYPLATFLGIDADKNEDLLDKYEVDSVPFFLVVKEGKFQASVEGADAGEWTRMIQGFMDKEGSVDDRIEKLLADNKIILFMKGSPNSPKCGFSRKMVELLKNYPIEYNYFDILLDMDVRQRLKQISNWPTYPQLYVNKELMGGLDIILEMHENNELTDVLK